MANGAPTPGKAAEVAAAAKQPLPIGTPEQLLNAGKVKEDPCYEVPELGCSLHLRGFTLAERLQMEERYVKDDGTEDEREKFKQYLLHGIVEPELNEEQVDRLLDETAHYVIQRIFGRIMVLNAGDTAAQRSVVEAFLAGSG